MKIPKYIDDALRMRTKYACLLGKKCSIVDEWLDKNGIECEFCDTHTGVEIYSNPFDSESRIRECIEKAGEENGRNI